MTKSPSGESLEVKSYSLGHFSKFLAIFYFENLGIIPKPTYGDFLLQNLGIIPKPTYGENYSSIF